jgi:glycosyltransferase involved in cell wall biosynthesis
MNKISVNYKNLNLPSFSVVIAVYINDNVDEFKQAIDSLLNQSYQPSEIVIVVDGVITAEVNLLIDEFKTNELFQIIELPVNMGLSNALNIGIQNSKHEIIARMDSDDVCMNDRFEKQIKHLISENLDIVGGQILEFKESTKEILFRREVPLEHSDIIRFMKYRSPFSHPSIVLKKSVFETINGYLVSFKGSAFQDYDFFVRAYMKGFKFGNVKDDVLYYRLGSDLRSMTRRRWGLGYAKLELQVYWNFYQYKFYNFKDFILNVVLKVPLRLLPFPLFNFIYFKLGRGKKETLFSNNNQF